MRELIRAHGDALTSTSANRPGVPPAMAATEIVAQWPDAIARNMLLVLDVPAVPKAMAPGFAAAAEEAARGGHPARPGSLGLGQLEAQ